MHTNSLTIGQVARRAGVGVGAVRFYEREGILEKPERDVSGYRRFPEEAVKRIGFIRRAQELGFTLTEIKDLIGLRVDPSVQCEEVRRCVESKRDDVQKKIESLQQIGDALESLLRACDGTAPIDNCPILYSLDDDPPAC